MANRTDNPVCQTFPVAWRDLLTAALDLDQYAELCDFVATERAEHAVYPPENEVFAALEAVAPEDVRVVILGQDPYHGEGQAHGLAFSVRPDIKPPPSLKNIFAELEDDLGIVAESPCLSPWAEQGVLLLNSVLTVRQSEPNSHQRRGWEQFTDAIVHYLAQRSTPIVFLLWGKPAEKKAGPIGPPHTVLTSPHPSPLSARRGFFGSKPFSATNKALKRAGLPTIDWQI